MSESDAGQRITLLLRAWQQGDARSGEEVVPLVYEELRRIARIRLQAERGGHTLQPTALVNEAWLRLMRQYKADWQNRTHFFAVAAQAMRRILVDYARKRQSEKRGSGETPITLGRIEESVPNPMRDEDLLALDDALGRLTAIDALQAQVVELRFFGGLSIEDTAEVLDLSSATVKREWATARAWLFRQIQRE